MKKNISINISGIIFHIEEDGYEKLRKYLDSINAYFSSYEDNSEILADIESRIAEIFLSKLSDGKQVISKKDVDSLMNTMGSVKDFQAAEEQDFAAAEEPSRSSKTDTGSTSETTAHKKLYRDQNRKILGGVCAGLAHYFSIDPVWPRLLFALLVLGSYGGLILVYVILWIVLPHSSELEEEKEVKKMFRDPDNKVVGGVASGVAAFFGTDISIVRVLFVVTTIFGGLGLLLYIILWIALPEAKSITEKMQMQGEPVTLSNIESSVKKGINEKESDEEESTLAKIILFPFRLIAMILNGIARIIGPLFSVGVDIFRVAFGVLFSIMGVLLIFCILVLAGVFLGFITTQGSTLWWDMDVSGLSFPMEALTNTFPVWVMAIVVIVCIIPALLIALLGVSIIAKKIVFRPAVGWTLFVIFFVCIAILSFKIPQTIYSFKEEATYKVEERFALENKTIVFKVNEVGLDDYDVASIRFIGHEENSINIIKRFQAQGGSRKAATENAQMVDYRVVKNDSIITMDSNITFNEGALFRAQRVDIEVYVPLATPFLIDEGLWRIVENYGRHRTNEAGTSRVWEMTESGIECINCESGTRKERNEMNQYDLSNFEAVELSGIFNVRIEQGDEYEVEVRGSDRQKRLYEIFREGETLIIDYENNGRISFWENSEFEDDQITINITMPHLRELNVKGAGKLRVRGFDENNMEVKLLGAISADGRVDVKNLNLSLTGLSHFDLDGEGRTMDVSLTGASVLNAYQFEVRHAIVDASGASSAKINATETLEIEESFASSVSHRGDPEVIRNN